jgi:hypothetical protein
VKLIVALVFTMIAFISAAGKNSVAYLEIAKVSSFQLLKTSYVSLQSANQAGQKDQASQGKTSDCQICHFGHCDFTIAAKFNFLIVAEPTDLDSVVSVFNIYDFHSGLFRPPIV